MSKLGISSSIKLAVKGDKPDTIVDVRGVKVGGNKLAIIAGPCSVESLQQVLETARSVKESGAHMMRGGAFKPRTLPYNFQGLGLEGLKYLDEARIETGLPIVTEVLSSEDVELVEQHADVLQIGARNMQNYPLLKRVGESSKPVLLKRGLSATIEELLSSAEYVLHGGNSNVILCERGIRTFETLTRFTLDLSSVPLVQQISPLPIIVDPSHGTGISSLVSPMSRAAIASGADGLLIEVHPDPAKALSDGAQSLTLDGFRILMRDLEPVVMSVGRTM